MTPPLSKGVADALVRFGHDGVYACRRWPMGADHEDIVQRFSGERRAFVVDLLGQARKGRTYWTLDVIEAATSLDQRGASSRRTTSRRSWRSASRPSPGLS